MATKMNDVRRATFCIAYRHQIAEGCARDMRRGSRMTADRAAAHAQACMSRVEHSLMTDARGAESVNLTQSILRTMRTLAIAENYTALTAYLNGADSYA